MIDFGDSIPQKLLEARSIQGCAYQGWKRRSAAPELSESGLRLSVAVSRSAAPPRAFDVGICESVVFWLGFLFW
jgi:hypothetical protein